MNHRELIIEELKKWKFDSILDVGCGTGQDLEMIRKTFPEVRIAGMDKDRDRIIKATKTLGNIQLVVGDTADLPFEDKSFDVVFTDALFVMIQDTGKVIRIMREMERVAKKYLLFLETHCVGDLTPEKYGTTMKNAQSYNIRNYEVLLSRFKPEFIKITKEVWPGIPWEFYGYLFKVTL